MSAYKGKSMAGYAAAAIIVLGMLSACTYVEVPPIEGDSAAGIEAGQEGKTESEHEAPDNGEGVLDEAPAGPAGETPEEPGHDAPDLTDDAGADGGPADPLIEALINKENPLEPAYAPDDLVFVEVPTVLHNPEVNQLRKEAAEALKRLFDSAEEAGFKLYARSGYRSYQTQAALFAGYFAREGEEAASWYSAKAGQSEHQSGLAMDVTSETVNLTLSAKFGDTEEGMWLAEHAHKFGYIIRYPKGKEEITGYMYEPWHIRYLGVDLAAKVYVSGLTLEEYFLEVERPSNPLVQSSSEADSQ